VSGESALLQMSYETELRSYRLACSRACAVTVIILVLLGILLDYTAYPAQQARLACARVVTSALIGIAIAMLYSERGKRHVQVITFTWLLLPQIMLAWMIYSTKGEASLFYAGLILTAFAVGSLFPVGYWHTLAFGAITLLLYYLACALRENGIQQHSLFAYHVIIVTFAVVASAVYTYFNEKARRQLFRLKEQLAQKNAELAEINHALVQIKGQLLQQEKMAAIGTLAAGLLHEVNNPVNFCLMAIDVALKEPAAREAPRLLECLVDTEHGMRRIQHIVADLKSFAYRKPGISEPTMDFMIDKAIGTAVRLTGHELKGISVTYALPSDTLVRGDEAAIIGVLINLLTNSALAIRKAGRTAPTIYVSARWAGERLRVAVKDNGPGIPPEDLTRVFEPFFTTRELGQGLGFGLSISYSVIERHGGTLVAESVVGEWTRMSFELPRAE
jgi:two-component system sensor histidine kinase PhcS